jgi:hypothetical protein
MKAAAAAESSCRFAKGIVIDSSISTTIGVMNDVLGAISYDSQHTELLDPNCFEVCCGLD